MITNTLACVGVDIDGESDASFIVEKKYIEHDASFLARKLMSRSLDLCLLVAF